MQAPGPIFGILQYLQFVAKRLPGDFFNFKPCVGSKGRVGGGPDPPIRPDTCLRLKFSHQQDCIPLFNWLIFLMKHTLHFANKLNSMDIQN